MSAETTTFAMFKGGVGKSTSAVNVAAALAREGHRTLLADLDPQANATEMFIAEADLDAARKRGEGVDMRSIIAEKIPVTDVIRPSRIPGLDVLPASFDLSYLDKELVVSPSGVMRIGRALRPVQNDYAHIVVDTGPNLSHLTLGALAASQHIVIPVSATVWASSGLRKFLGWIDQHRDDEVLHAQLLGLVGTRVRPRTRIGQQLLQDLATSGLPAFAAWIPERIRAEDAAMHHLVVGDPGMDISLDTAYRDLTKEMLHRLEQAPARHAVR